MSANGLSCPLFVPDRPLTPAIFKIPGGLCRLPNCKSAYTELGCPVRRMPNKLCSGQSPETAINGRDGSRTAKAMRGAELHLERGCREGAAAADAAVERVRYGEVPIGIASAASQCAFADLAPGFHVGDL